MNNKKINKLVVLSATLTLGVSPLIDTALPILNNSIVVKATEVAKTVELTAKAGTYNDSVLYIAEQNNGILANQKYEISAVGNGQIEFYHDKNISETNDIWSIVDGDGTETKVKTFLENDVIRINANKGTDLKLIFTPINLDLSRLKSLNEQAKGLLSGDENKYVLETWQKLISANRDAEYALSNTDITQKELTTVENALENAINNLTKLIDVVDRDELEKLINKAKNIDKDKYTDATVKDLNTALTNAVKVNDDETSDQNAINEVATKLKKALDNLKAKTINKDNLGELITSATSYQKDKYTDESWKNFEDALNDAKKVLKDDKATQAEVDNAEKVLSDAIDNLKKKDGTEEPGNEDKPILVGNTITLANNHLGYYAVYYDVKKDELSFKEADLSSIFGVEPPKPLENINLNGEKTFVVNDEKWELIDNKNGTYNLKYLNNQVIRFNNLEEYADLVENYGLFHYVNNKVERITDTDLDFDAEYIDLNSEEGQSYNNNQVPELNFEFDDTSFSFDFKFDENNQLAYHSFKYTYDLSDDFISSDVYKKFEGKEQFNGYIKRNLLNAGGYQAYVMQYQLVDGKLEIKVLNTSIAEPVKHGRPVEDLNGEGKIEVEIPLIPDKPTEKEELPVFKPTIRKEREKIVETKQPKKVIKEEVPKMGVGPEFMGVPLVGVGIGGLAIALIALLRRKFPIVSKINKDNDIEE